MIGIGNTRTPGQGKLGKGTPNGRQDLPSQGQLRACSIGNISQSKFGIGKERPSIGRAPSVFILQKESPLDAHLHIAALQGDVDTLRRVLDSGRVHVDCKDRDGTTPLILAAANGHLDCVDELLEQGADPRARRTTGTTALFFAAQGGFVDIAQTLLDNGAQVDSASMVSNSGRDGAVVCGPRERGIQQDGFVFTDRFHYTAVV
ncbi:ankyrin homolog, partial [Frankliniella occidentalis]|uniref:Ankyrin homolog n=1 Tax=Frankliniella occidentalis TaxID=133901 RepID=A0A9C6XBK7_FRAOC